MVEKKLNHHLTVVLKRNCIWNVLLHVHYYNLLRSFKLVKEKDPKFVQDFTGAGRELNSLDSQLVPEGIQFQRYYWVYYCLTRA